ncbi:hypothetical protein QZH41_016737, partial [Actinostola sp. cb2023]
IILAAKRKTSDILCKLLEKVKRDEVSKDCFSQALLAATAKRHPCRSTISAILSHVARLSKSNCLDIDIISPINLCFLCEDFNAELTGVLVLCWVAVKNQTKQLKYFLGMRDVWIHSQSSDGTFDLLINSHPQRIQSIREVLRKKKCIDISLAINMAIACKHYGAAQLLLAHGSLAENEAMYEVNWNSLELTNLHHQVLNGMSHRRQFSAKVLQWGSITRIDLRRNNLTQVPSMIFQLPLLSNLLLSNNKLKDLPELRWISESLNHLYLSHNALKSLPMTFSWSNLRTLKLDGNGFTEVPRCVCELSALETLNIRGNPISALPLKLGLLSKLSTFEFERRKIVYPQGVEVSEVEMQPRFGRVLPIGTKITFQVWDFAGQKEFHLMHMCFLSSVGLFILVWNLMDDLAGIEELKTWLNNISCQTSTKTTVIIVGTHLDCVKVKYNSRSQDVKNYIERTRTLISQMIDSRTKDNVLVVDIAEVSCNPSDTQGISELKEKIYKAGGDIVKGKGIRVLEEPVPMSFHHLVGKIERLRNTMCKNKEIPIVNRDQLRSLMRDISSTKDEHLVEQEFDEAVEFLKDRGIILYFDDPSQDLRDVYFIDPRWLFSLMNQVICNNSNDDGLVRKDKLFSSEHDGEDAILTENSITQGIRLLSRFQLVHDFDDDYLLMPSRVINIGKSWIITTNAITKATTIIVINDSTSVTTIVIVVINSNDNNITIINNNNSIITVINNINSNNINITIINNNSIINNNNNSSSIINSNSIIVTNNIINITIVNSNSSITIINSIIINSNSINSNNITVTNNNITIINSNSSITVINNRIAIINNNRIIITVTNNNIINSNSSITVINNRIAIINNNRIIITVTNNNIINSNSIIITVINNRIATTTIIVNNTNAAIINDNIINITVIINNTFATIVIINNTKTTTNNSININFNTINTFTTIIIHNDAKTTTCNSINNNFNNTTNTNISDTIVNNDIKTTNNNSINSNFNNTTNTTTINIIISTITVVTFDVQQNLIFEYHHLHYDETSVIKEGSFGKVYRAVLNKPDGPQTVAVKQYKGDDLSSFMELRKEVNILRRIKHPNLIEMIGVARNPRCMVFELAQHGSLDGILFDAPATDIPRLVVVSISREIVDALSRLHGANIIHRDLKPANVLVFSLQEEDAVHVKVADFGTANFVGPSGMRTPVGRTHIRAPEVLEFALKEDYGVEVDIYSFAILLYGLVSRTRAFEDLPSNKIRSVVLQQQRPMWRNVKDTLSKFVNLTRLMCVAWNQESTDRPTAEECSVQLRNPGFQALMSKLAFPPESTVYFIHLVSSKEELWVVYRTDSLTFVCVFSSKLDSNTKHNFLISATETLTVECVCASHDKIIVLLRKNQSQLGIFKMYTLFDATLLVTMNCSCLPSTVHAMTISGSHIFIASNIGCFVGYIDAV